GSSAIVPQCHVRRGLPHYNGLSRTCKPSRPDIRQSDGTRQGENGQQPKDFLDKSKNPMLHASSNFSMTSYEDGFSFPFEYRRGISLCGIFSGRFRPLNGPAARTLSRMVVQERRHV